MTTSRERYEAKTRVVTFRVTNELHDEIEKVRVERKLSFADLIKLGVGIAQDSIKTKLEESGNLKAELRKLRQAVQSERNTLTESLTKERKERLARLEKEMQIIKLFDIGWTTREVSLKLNISDKESLESFKEWGKLRRQRKAVQNELVKRCLEKHICSLQEHIHFRATKNSLDEAKSQMERCLSLLSDPSKMTGEERTFLLTKYSYLL